MGIAMKHPSILTAHSQRARSKGAIVLPVSIINAGMADTSPAELI